MFTKAKKVYPSDAAQIAYYLIAVDGDVTKPEIRSFNKIAEELGVKEKKDWEKAENAVKTILESHNDPDKIYTKIMVNIYDITKNIKSASYFAGWQGINPYLLLWDLLTLSIADNNFSGNEEKLITHLAEELEIDKSILMEMDNAIRALYSVRAEEKWLKESGRDESEIKEILSQLEKRKTVINNSVKLFFDDME